jgi:hypothetical protein
LTLSGLAACDGDGARHHRWRVAIDTLSNGALLVVNYPPEERDSSDSWRVKEEIRIGGMGSTEPWSFADVRGLSVDEAGRFYVLDGVAGELRVFDPAGAYVGTIGQEEIGPLQTNGIALAPDGTIWIADVEAGRMLVFDTLGEMVATHHVPLAGAGSPWQGGFDEEGHLEDIALLPPESPDRTPTLRRFDEELRVVETYPLPRDEGTMFNFPQGATRVPFAGPLRWIVDPRGYVWFADTDLYRIYKRRFEGDTLQVIESWRDPLPVTEGERDSALARLRGFMDLVGEAYIEVERIPDTKPVLENIDLDSSGRLWVRVTSERPNTLFEVFDTTGVFMAAARADFRIPDWWHPIIRDSLIYALTQSDLGVPYVIRARIEKE